MKRAPTSNKHARTPSVSFADFALIATEKKSERKAQLPSLFFFFFFFFFWVVASLSTFLKRKPQQIKGG